MGYEAHQFIVSFIGDVIFVASLFVLSGDFGDKIRALFIHNDRAKLNDVVVNQTRRGFDL